ncbi:MAG TPA: nitroreductase family protein [Terriglobales bacterium]|nr:nitroreductase family protein [Terriglobales bacterium]
MEYFEVVQRRQSIRKYKSRPIESEKLEAILKAANQAPSAGNFQAYEIYVVKTAALRQAIARSTWDQEWIANAAVLLVFCTHAARCQYPGAEIYAMQDASIATTQAMLAVTAVGLGACWVGAFDPKKVSEVVGTPVGVQAMAILAIGYADEKPERTPRRPLSDVVHEL